MDRLKAMETFVRVARSGSYAKAAEQLSMSRSQVTKHIQQLEDRLQTRLFNRTTRQVALTEMGAEYFDLCLRILGDVEEAERSVARRNSEPSGLLKIVSPMGFGNLQLAPIVAEFMLLYPLVKVAVVLNDVTMTPVEMIDGNYDLAIQTGDLQDTAIVARKVGTASWIACGAPAYLERAGRPRTLADLAAHNCFVHRKTTPDGIWHFLFEGRPIDVRVEGTLSSNSVSVLQAAVVAGNGISVLPRYCVGEDLASGKLEAILPDYRPASRAINVLVAHGRLQPGKVRLFINFLSERLRDFE